MKYHPHITDMDKAQKCSTLPKKLPLCYFSDFLRKKSLLCRQWVICAGLQHVCRLALDCRWDGWLVLLVFLCSPQRQLWERDSGSGIAGSGRSHGNSFLGQTSGALKATSSLVPFAEAPIDWTGCPQTESKVIKAEISTQSTGAGSVFAWVVIQTATPGTCQVILNNESLVSF